MEVHNKGECRPRTTRGQYTCDNLKKPITVYLPDSGQPNSYGDLVFIKKYPNKHNPLVFLSNQYKVNNSDMVILGNDDNPLYISAIFNGKSWILDEIIVNKGEKLSTVIQLKKNVDDKRNNYKYASDNIGGIPKVDVTNDGKLKVNRKGKVQTTRMEGGGKAVMLNFDNYNDKNYDKDMVLDLSDDSVAYEPSRSYKNPNNNAHVPENQEEQNDLLNRRPKHPSLIYEGDRVILTNDNFDEIPAKMPPIDKGFYIDDDDDDDLDSSIVERRKINKKAYDAIYEGFHLPEIDSD